MPREASLSNTRCEFFYILEAGRYRPHLVFLRRNQKIALETLDRTLCIPLFMFRYNIYIYMI